MKPITTKVNVVAVIRSARGNVSEFAGEVEVVDMGGYVKGLDLEAAILEKIGKCCKIEKIKEVAS